MKLNVKIEKGVSMPKGKKWDFLAKLEVGDSFIFPIGIVKKPTQLLCQEGKKLGVKFSSKRTNEGLRVWRIK